MFVDGAGDPKRVENFGRTNGNGFGTGRSLRRRRLNFGSAPFYHNTGDRVGHAAFAVLPILGVGIKGEVVHGTLQDDGDADELFRVRLRFSGLPLRNRRLAHPEFPPELDLREVEALAPLLYRLPDACHGKSITNGDIPVKL